MVLIFDEPTAVLTPQEIDELIVIMKELVKEGKSIILITHKLDEIKAVADRCTVIRITVQRSATALISSNLCVIKMIDLPSLTNSFMITINSSIS